MFKILTRFFPLAITCISTHSKADTWIQNPSFLMDLDTINNSDFVKGEIITSRLKETTYRDF